ncbi:hypothetical protein CRE_31210 [Caenorhabditis remanei]|uniref:Uncharacterized protein n=1 Tax=Caenorhabditis remanei TaxID=31234 RepID=E3MLL2_CAERE|nr:hypothetical protein CRE_31210 [Caenorhabditis remanei]
MHFPSPNTHEHSFTHSFNAWTTFFSIQLKEGPTIIEGIKHHAGENGGCNRDVDSADFLIGIRTPHLALYLFSSLVQLISDGSVNNIEIEHNSFPSNQEKLDVLEAGPLDFHTIPIRTIVYDVGIVKLWKIRKTQFQQISNDFFNFRMISLTLRLSVSADEPDAEIGVLEMWLTLQVSASAHAARVVWSVRHKKMRELNGSSGRKCEVGGRTMLRMKSLVVQYVNRNAKCSVVMLSKISIWLSRI